MNSLHDERVLGNAQIGKRRKRKRMRLKSQDDRWMFDDFILANQIVRIGMKKLSVWISLITSSYAHCLHNEHFYVLPFINAILVLSFNTFLILSIFKIKIVIEHKNWNILRKISQLTRCITVYHRLPSIKSVINWLF